MGRVKSQIKLRASGKAEKTFVSYYFFTKSERKKYDDYQFEIGKAENFSIQLETRSGTSFHFIKNVRISARAYRKFHTVLLPWYI